MWVKTLQRLLQYILIAKNEDCLTNKYIHNIIELIIAYTRYSIKVHGRPSTPGPCWNCFIMFCKPPIPPAKGDKQRRKVQRGKEDRGGKREMRWRNGGKNRRESWFGMVGEMLSVLTK